MKQMLIVFICCMALLLTGCDMLSGGLLSAIEEAERNAASTPTRTPRPDRDTDPTPSQAPGWGGSGAVQGAASPEASSFPFRFTAQDLYGDTVTEAALGDKEIFFVHLWATWCPPCIAEMPELGQVVEMYSDRVGFFGLLLDYDTDRDAALRIKESSGANFLNVDANLPDFRELMRLVESGFVPTTILIDREGNVIGDQIIGARGLGYAVDLDAALNR